MLSFFSSLFFDSNSSKKSYITNTLKTLNKPYTDVSNGINVDITNTQNINENCQAKCEQKGSLALSQHFTNRCGGT